MSEPGVIRRFVIPLILLGATVLGFLNTYGDASAVQELAGKTACGGGACVFHLRELQRNPFGHEYTFDVGKQGTRVLVKCAREWIFLGEYSCRKH